jgi:casein kinase I family protein HRR25
MRQHYNPVSATWDLIRDAKVANEELLTLGLPPEFDVLYRYARSLEFDDLPDYEGLRKLFRGLAERVGIEYDGFYDWTVPPSKVDTTPPTMGFGKRIASDGAGGRHCAACNARRNTE